MKITKVKCVDCGEEFEVQGYKKKERCSVCAFKRCGEAAHQMMAKSGPFYDKWVESMKQIPDNIEQQAEKMKQRYIEGRKWRAGTL